MITEDYVSFEIAKLLQKKGFSGEFHKHYWGYKPGREFLTSGGFNSEYDYPAPTLQTVMKWLRKVHNLFIFISTWLRHKDGTIQYYYEIRNLNDEDFETIVDSTIAKFDSPEKTCEVAIKYCLENLI